MSAHAITLQLPESLYERLKKRVEWTKRSLEDEVLDAVAFSASAEDELSPELMDAVESLEVLDDDDLWRLAQESMSREASQELEALHFKQRDEGLDETDEAIRAKLIREYERTILIRAQAAHLLKQRGYGVSGIVAAK